MGWGCCPSRVYMVYSLTINRYLLQSLRLGYGLGIPGLGSPVFGSPVCSIPERVSLIFEDWGDCVFEDWGVGVCPFGLWMTCRVLWLLWIVGGCTITGNLGIPGFHYFGIPVSSIPWRVSFWFQDCVFQYLGLLAVTYPFLDWGLMVVQSMWRIGFHWGWVPSILLYRELN